MRLIDADELLKKAYERGKWMPIPVVNVEDIQEAPTIDAEPVRHGEWIRDNTYTSKNKLKYVCSVCCSWMICRKHDRAMNPIWMRYCTSCGARMKYGGKQDG